MPLFWLPNHLRRGPLSALRYYELLRLPVPWLRGVILSNMPLDLLGLIFDSYSGKKLSSMLSEVSIGRLEVYLEEMSTPTSFSIGLFSWHALKMGSFSSTLRLLLDMA